MFNEIIFVDFENFTNITDDIKKADAKIIVFVGLNQAQKAFTFSNELLDSVSSIELLKVKGTGKNALDFFITYYLGIYINRYKNMNFTICSNDHGYDPLIKHLRDNGISIKRLETHKEQIVVEKKPKAKTTQKPKKQSNLFETDEDYKKVLSLFSKMAKNKPKKLNSLETHLKSHFHETIKLEKIKKIINELKKCKYIDIVDEKIKYNL